MREISQEMIETISTIAVMQSCATDPGQLLIMTGSLLSWIEAGLTAKYGFELIDLDPKIYAYLDPVAENSIPTIYDEAVVQYGAHKTFWPEMLKKCRAIASKLISIAVAEELLDYKTIAHSFTDQMKALQVSSSDQESLSEEKEPTRRQGYKKGDGQI